MSLGYSPPDTHIGGRLKDSRRALGLTLAEVSKVTGVSVSSISKIENNQVSPSFDIIKKLCDGLNMDLVDFIRPGQKSGVSGRKAITRQGEGARFESREYDYKVHATELSRKLMAPLEMRLRARSVEEFDHWSQHTGEEFLYVLSGVVEVHTEHYEPFRLEAGESAYFDSSMKHLLLSVSPQDATILSVSCDPAAPTQAVTQFMNPSVRLVGGPSEATDGA